MSVEISPIPIELSSGRRNVEVFRMPEWFDQVHCDGKKLGSVVAVGVLNDRDTIQSTGMSASAITTRSAPPQPIRCRTVLAAISVPPPFLCEVPSSLPDVRSGSGGAEALDEDGRDDRDADQDQDRHRRPDPEVEPGEKGFVVEDRHREGAGRTAGADE